MILYRFLIAFLLLMFAAAHEGSAEMKGDGVAKTATRPATLVKTVRFEQKGGLKLIVTSDGMLSPHVFLLDQGRLVIDLPGVKSKVRTKAIPVKNRAVKQVRIGQHPDKLRLVLDLAGPVDYALEQNKNRLTIFLKEVAVSQPDRPPSSGGAPPERTAGKISMDFRDADIVTVLHLIADVSRLNIKIGEDVKGIVTVKLDNISWEEALGVVLKMNHLDLIREGSLLRIIPSTKVSPEKNGEAKEEGLATRVYKVRYGRLQELSEEVKNALSERGSLIIDDKTSSLIVKDIDGKITELAQLVKLLDKPAPRVEIETRVVTVAPTFQQGLNILWESALPAVGKERMIGFVNADPNISSSEIFPPDYMVAPPSISTGEFLYGRLEEDLSSLDRNILEGEARGVARMVTMPRLSMLSDQEAAIETKGGRPEAASSHHEESSPPFASNITVFVTPRVAPEKTLAIDLAVLSEELSGMPGGLRKIASPIAVKDGETIVIGRFDEMSSSDTDKEDSSLLIFLTPRLLK